MPRRRLRRLRRAPRAAARGPGGARAPVTIRVRVPSEAAGTRLDRFLAELPEVDRVVVRTFDPGDQCAQHLARAGAARDEAFDQRRHQERRDHAEDHEHRVARLFAERRHPRRAALAPRAGDVVLPGSRGELDELTKIYAVAICDLI